MGGEKEKGIPSPFGAMFGAKPPIIKHLDINVSRPRGKDGFMDQIAFWALLVVGAGAAYAFTAYTPGSAEDWVGTVAFASWNLACVLSIAEHSRRSEVEKINIDDQAIIKKAIDHFNKI